MSDENIRQIANIKAYKSLDAYGIKNNEIARKIAD
jgi:hypothetical protein